MQILRMPAVKAETGHASHASIYTSVHDGTFTVPVPIGQRAVGWPDHEVKAINQARIRGDSDDQIRALVNKQQDKQMAPNTAPTIHGAGRRCARMRPMPPPTPAPPRFPAWKKPPVLPFSSSGTS